MRLFVPRPSWSSWPTAWSVGLHGLLFAVAGWATRGGYQLPLPTASEHLTRAYAMHYLLLARPEPRHEPRPERRPDRRPTPEASVMIPATLPSPPTIADAGTPSEPRWSAVQVKELPSGTMAGIGLVESAQRSHAASARVQAPEVPGSRQAASLRLGANRGAELVSRVGSACPELRRPAAWAGREVAVSVAFVVDTNGRVDPETLRVIESPNRPQTDKQFHSHIYIVGATARDDRDRLDPAVYDSVVTRDVASHVADLVFRPALREGLAIRSNVVVSCQTS